MQPAAHFQPHRSAARVRVTLYLMEKILVHGTERFLVLLEKRQLVASLVDQPCVT